MSRLSFAATTSGRVNRCARTLTSLLCGTLVAGVAWAGTPFFSGPSLAKVAAPITFSGKGFVPNAAVTVMVNAPDGAKAGFSAVVDADGSFSYTYTPSTAGAHSLQVTNSAGKPLATALLNAHR